jgi:glycosyltransferase involved in cell wall biosynthesis
VVTLLDMTFFLHPQLHTRAKRLYFPRIIRMSARRADAFAAISESTRKDAIRLLNIPSEKIFTTPLGVDRDFRLVEDMHLLEGVRVRYKLPEKFVLYVGLIEPRKNLPLLIRVYRQMAAQGTPFDLVLAGRLGWNYQEVLESIERFGLRDRVHMPGYIAQEDLPFVYNLASLFVYPTTYEGFGLPVLEAMACGVPVITTRISSLPEIVGDAGELLPENDEAAFRKAVLRLLNDSDLHEQRKIAGLSQAAKFTWERTARLTLQIYYKVLQATHTG